MIIDTDLRLKMQMKFGQLLLHEILQLIHAQTKFSPAKEKNRVSGIITQMVIAVLTLMA